jgi:hypothetical protein
VAFFGWSLDLDQQWADEAPFCSDQHLQDFVGADEVILATASCFFDWKQTEKKNTECCWSENIRKVHSEKLEMTHLEQLYLCKKIGVSWRTGFESETGLVLRAAFSDGVEVREKGTRQIDLSDWEGESELSPSEQMRNWRSGSPKI